jgi:hypothetical protein
MTYFGVFKPESDRNPWFWQGFPKFIILLAENDASAGEQKLDQPLV